MKEFTSAVEEAISEDEREEKIEALVAKGYTRERAEDEVDNGMSVEFKLDGRVMRAYQPHEGQLVFMMASMGRGQSNDQRFAAIVNVMVESLRGSDKDYLEGRLLTGGKDRLKLSVIEDIFTYLTENWFPDESAESGSSV